ncbi:MAG: hypothetical protein BMS9Abin33_0702 [Gammaproteobacteria bacterium]|nr:MAG: hypothetical protein BMS9Abin33_0702 [Gammaproteobacteria bacterium]
MTHQTQHPKKTQAEKQTAAEKAAAQRSVARQQGVAAEERHRMVAEAAYLIAEQRGFQGGRLSDGISCLQPVSPDTVNLVRCYRTKLIGAQVMEDPKSITVQDRVSTVSLQTPLSCK